MICSGGAPKHRIPLDPSARSSPLTLIIPMHKLETRINGEVVQKQTTADLIFPVTTIVSFISQAITLEPGDAIFTGTPGTTTALKAGDVVEIEIEGIGVLQNNVVAQ